MEFSCSNIKKKSYISRNKTPHFLAQDRKIKKNTTRKKKLFCTSGNIFSKYLSAIFYQKKIFFLFLKMETLKNFLIFQEVTLGARIMENSLLKIFL